MIYSVLVLTKANSLVLTFADVGLDVLEMCSCSEQSAAQNGQRTLLPFMK